MDISVLDKNMLGTAFVADGLKFFSPAEAPVCAHGMMYNEELQQYRRIPEEAAKNASNSVYAYNNHLTGGRFIFRTNTDKLAIRFKIPWDGVKEFNQANAGIDVYERVNGKQTLLRTFKPTTIDENRFISITRELGGKKDRELVIYLPGMAGTSSYTLGIDEDAYIAKGEDYKYSKPVVFYGSSIVHGAQSYRPALAYPSMISRKYDLDFVNLGYSGQAKGEQSFAEYIKTMDMAAFVLDYDHNAPTPEHLEATHEIFYKTVREANPDLPIIMITRPQFHVLDYAEVVRRREIIYATYENAKARGENVYFIDGGHFYDAFGGDDCAADDSHPNTLGFFAMSETISKVLEEAIGIERI